MMLNTTTGAELAYALGAPLYLPDALSKALFEVCVFGLSIAQLEELTALLAQGEEAYLPLL